MAKYYAVTKEMASYLLILKIPLNRVFLILNISTEENVESVNRLLTWFIA